MSMPDNYVYILITDNMRLGGPRVSHSGLFRPRWEPTPRGSGHLFLLPYYLDNRLYYNIIRPRRAPPLGHAFFGHIIFNYTGKALGK